MTSNDAHTRPWKPEYVGAVDIEIAGYGLEMNPPPDQRERDGGREHAAPHDQPVCETAKAAAAEDKAICGELEERPAEKLSDVSSNRLWR
jgi:hypothetical protein